MYQQQIKAKQQVFIKELQPNFSLRKPKGERPTNVYLVCRVNGKQRKLSTGLKVYPSHWNKRTQEASISVHLCELDNKNNQILNDRIREIKASFFDYNKYLCDNIEQIDNSLIILRSYVYKEEYMIQKKKEKPQINATIQIMQLVEEKNCSESTKRQYRTYVRNFEKFLAKEKISNSWKSFDYNLLKRYENTFDNYRTLENNMSLLLWVLKTADSIKGIDFNIKDSEVSRYKIRQKTEDDKGVKIGVALTEDEIMKFYNYMPTGKRAIQDAMIRDMFVLQCLVGQRISDMAKVVDTDIRNGYITFYSKKTKVLTNIPTNTKPMKVELINELLTRLKQNNDYKFYDTPNNSTINERIKYIAKSVDLNRIVSNDEKAMLLGKKIEDGKPIQEVLSSHDGRYTFITQMCRLGMPKETLIKITGHTSPHEIDNVYALLSLEDIQSTMSESLQKTVEKNNLQPIKTVEPTTVVIVDTDEITTIKTSYPNGKIITETTNHWNGYTETETVYKHITEYCFKDNTTKEKKIVDSATGISKTEHIDLHTGIVEIEKKSSNNVESTIIHNGLVETEYTDLISGVVTYMAKEQKTGKVLEQYTKKPDC